MSWKIGIAWLFVLGASARPAEAQALFPRPAWTADGNQVAAGFGSGVAAAGDVNGDGHADILVGAYQGGTHAEGTASVFHGSPSGPSKIPDWRAEGDDDYANFGSSMAGAGDVNGDRFDDVIVGAHQGRFVRVYLGGEAGLAATPAWTVRSRWDYEFGWSVSSAGDVDADGFDDVIVSAMGFSGDQVSEGRVLLYRGSPTGPEKDPAWFVDGNQSYARFGNWVATAGDVNGDGYDDVIVGAPYWSNGQTRVGRLFVYLGSASGLATTADWSVDGDSPYTGLGYWVSSAGDVNGDGFDDVIATANSEGRAYVYLGSSAGLATVEAWESQDPLGSPAGAVSSGDLNGDGFSDVLVGLYAFGQNRGAAFAYFGSSAGLATRAGWSARGSQVASLFGFALAGAGDVDGDGLADVLVGAYGFHDPETLEGRAYTYLGSETRRLR